MIQVKNLNVYFNKFHALKDINLSFDENKIHALIGPSGCGKSTFLRSLNRLHDEVETARVEGEVLFDGKDILSTHTDLISLRKEIGMVFQKPSPFPHLTIYENLVIGPKYWGEKNKKVLDQKVEEILIKVGLFDEVKDKLSTLAIKLSGGQQQRMCIARTLILNPKVVLLDEPTSALDPISTQIIEKLLVDLKNEISFIIVTHNMQQAKRISDSTSFFYQGDLIETGSADVIFNHAKVAQTRDYISGIFG